MYAASVLIEGSCPTTSTDWPAAAIEFAATRGIAAGSRLRHDRIAPM